MVLLLKKKLYLKSTKDQDKFYYIPGWSNFFQGGGPNANFYRNPYTYLFFSRGGVSGPPITL